MKLEDCPTEEEVRKFCRNCTACCLWPGAVYFPPESLPAIAAFLGLDEQDCAEKFFELSKDRARLQAKEAGGGRCIFLDSDGCSIYPLRPRACRTFPRGWQRPEKELMEQCRLYRAFRWQNHDQEDRRPARR